MECTNNGCNSQKTRVLETVDYSGRIRRRRKCRDCGHRFTTTERPANEKSDQTPPVGFHVGLSIAHFLESSGMLADGGLRESPVRPDNGT